MCAVIRAISRPTFDSYFLNNFLSDLAGFTHSSQVSQSFNEIITFTALTTRSLKTKSTEIESSILEKNECAVEQQLCNHSPKVQGSKSHQVYTVFWSAKIHFPDGWVQNVATQPQLLLEMVF